MPTVAPARVAKSLDSPPDILTPADVSRLVRVDPKTVTRWAHSGKIPCFKTLGGHRRYKLDDIRVMMRLTLRAGEDLEQLLILLWNEPNVLLTPGDVAGRYRVYPKTVARWERQGTITAVFRLPGQHRRFLATDESFNLTPV